MFRFRIAIVLICVLLCSISNKLTAQFAPVQKRAVRFAESIRVMDMPVLNSSYKVKQVINEENEIPLHKINPNAKGTADAALYSKSISRVKNDPTPQIPNPASVSFDGIDITIAPSGFLPPDVTGEAGPNHFVQAVNSCFRVYSKTGTPLTSVTALGTLFGPLGAPVGTRNDGDPIVLYDQLADRWIISQFALIATPNYHQLIAVSKTNDPTGAYWLYDFMMPNNKFNDYGKFGLWHDGYYMTDNQFNQAGTAFLGAGVFAFDRAKMLKGDPTASFIYFDLGTSFGGMLPADLDGLTPPPSTSPCPFIFFEANEYGAPTDRLRIFDFHADYSVPANSTFAERTGSPLTVAAFDPREIPSGSGNNIPQSGTAIKLDALGDRMMFRLGYRNLGSTEVLIANHTVNAAVNPAYRTGVRFYQLNRATSTSAFTITEQQTFDGSDANYRWMASGAMNWQSDVALGYSIGSATTFPSISYAARLGTDAPGTGLAQGERSLFSGTGSQTSSSGRWGDYSHISVDPVDDCSFWYTAEYLTTTTPNNWRTRILKFAPGTTTTSPRGTLTGTITNCSTGLPIQNVSVSLSGGFFRQTSAAGTYSAFLPPSTYTVTYSAPNYNSLTTSVIITNGGVTTSSVCLIGVPIIISAGATITAESCGPANNGIDPNETVSVNFCVQNTGTGNTTNLVGTLLATGGVTSPGVPQTFGVVIVGGASVCKTFSFVATGTCGGTLTASIHYQDGAIDLGTKTYTFTLGGLTTTTFSNAASVTIPTSGNASIYPSNVVVSGITGTVIKVAVTLKGLNHATPNDIDMLLVSPTGQKYILLSDILSTTALTGQTYTLDDAASGIFPSSGAPASGSFRPTNYGIGDAFGAPAPSSPYQDAATAGSATFASMFNSLNPNGTWNLYIVDDAAGVAGTMTGGWDLNITTIACCLCTPDPQSITGPSSVCLGSTLDLAGSPSDAGTGVVWLSSNTAVATVSSSGVVSTVATGISTITYQYTNGSACTGTTTKLIIVNPLPTAGVGGVSTTCYNSTSGNITFTGANGTAPYTFAYKINGGATQTVTTVSGNSVNVSVSAGTPGQFGYVLQSVSDANGCGQTQSGVFTVTVQAAPTIVCPGSVSTSTSFNQCTATVNGLTPVSFNPAACNGSNSVISYSITGATIRSGLNDAGGSFGKGVSTVTYTITDAQGNTSACSFTVTVNDNEAPAISCPGNLSKAANATCTYASSSGEFDPSASSDNCSGSMNSYSLGGSTTATNVVANTLNGVFFNKGITTITWKTTDAAGNSSSCNFNITINDNKVPSIVCVGNQSRSAGANCTYSAAAVEFDPVSFSDNCSGTVNSYSLSGVTSATSVVANTLNGVVFNKGITTVTWKITDGSGNSSSCSFNVTVNDNQLPSIVCPGDQSKGTNATCTYASSSGEFDPVSSADNCSGSFRSYSLSGVTTASNVVANTLNGVFFNKGITIVTWKITDVAGNSTSCNFNITVTDNQPPTIICAGDQVKSANASCTYASASGEFDPVSSGDNCPGSIRSYSLSGAAIATNIFANSLNGVFFNIGITAVSWKITDAAGNIANCSFNVTINDNQPPVITCPGNLSVGNNATCTYASTAGEFDPVSSSDNCSGSFRSYSLSGATAASNVVTNTLNGVFLNKGITTVTWKITDAAGNSTSCSFIANVNDIQPPAITCAGNQVRSTNTACMYTSASGEFDPVSFNDNCAGTVNSYSLSGATTATNVVANTLNGISFNKGNTTVTWKITDASGNSSNCSCNITVNDTQAPTIICPGNQAKSATASCTYSSASGEFDPVSFSDNCPGSFISYSLSGATTATNVVANTLNGVVFNQGNTTVTWKVADATGNSSSCSFTSFISDIIKPVIICPTNISASPNTAACRATVNIPAPSVSDCNSSINISYQISGAGASGVSAGSGAVGTRNFEVGTTVITYLVTDGSGNTQSCSTNITVTNTLQASIGGTVTVVQNSSTTASVNFTGVSGSPPYEFTYILSKDGSITGTYTVTTSGTNTATVTQLNFPAGVYVYKLLAVTDVFGCPGIISSQNTATITILADPEDFTPTVDVTALGFAAAGSGKDFLVNINEISQLSANNGSIQFKVVKLSAFTITYALVNGTSDVFGPVSNNNGDWNFSENPFFITVTLKPSAVVNPNTFNRIGFHTTRNAEIAPNTSQPLTIIIVNGSGGDSNPNNNTSNTVMTAQ